MSYILTDQKAESRQEREYRQETEQTGNRKKNRTQRIDKKWGTQSRQEVGMDYQILKSASLQ